MYLAVGMARAQDVKEVWLNGEKVEHVIELDTTEGWVQKYVTNRDGEFILEGDEIKRETLTGEVKVFF